MTKDSVRVIIRVRPADAETKQYNGGLFMQERRAAAARAYLDDIHDVVSLSSGPSLPGRRLPSSVSMYDGASADQRFNLVRVQQVKMAGSAQTSSSSGKHAGAGGGKQHPRSRSSEDGPLSARSGGGDKYTGSSMMIAPAARKAMMKRSASAKSGRSSGFGRSNTNMYGGPSSSSAAAKSGSSSFVFDGEDTSQQQQPQHSSRSGGAGAAAPVRCARYCFEYDACFSSNPHHPAHADQNKMYQVIGKPAVDHVLKGFNFTCLCYGQTGSGKTYTMFGVSREELLDFSPASRRGSRGRAAVQEERGLVYRVAEVLCARMAHVRRSASAARGVSRSSSLAAGAAREESSVEPDPRRPHSLSVEANHPHHHLQTLHHANGSSGTLMTMTVSFFEIYCDKVWCLVNPTEPLRVREHKINGPFVEGLEEVVVTSVEDVYRIVEAGSANRHFAATLHNHHSSRSHALLLFNVHQRQPAVNSGIDGASANVFLSSKLYMVDLAGSERVSPHDEIHHTHRSEAKYINSSLSVLGKVITALAQVSKSGGGGGDALSAGKPSSVATFIPYRDSVITRLLRDSFGGNSKTVMIAAVSPEVKDLEETISTLRFASRARYIQNRPVVNSAMQAEDRDRDAIIETLARRVEELEQQLQNATATATIAAAANSNGLITVSSLQQQHQQQQYATATATATAPQSRRQSTRSDPSTRAPSLQQTSCSVGLVRWGGGAFSEKQAAVVGEKQQHNNNTKTTTSSSTSPSQQHSSSSNNPQQQATLYQQLLERTEQQQTMLERIEDRENMLLRILSSQNDPDSYFNSVMSPPSSKRPPSESAPMLMRGPTQTPGPQKYTSKHQQLQKERLALLEAAATAAPASAAVPLPPASASETKENAPSTPSRTLLIPSSASQQPPHLSSTKNSSSSSVVVISPTPSSFAAAPPQQSLQQQVSKPATAMTTQSIKKEYKSSKPLIPASASSSSSFSTKHTHFDPGLEASILSKFSAGGLPHHPPKAPSVSSTVTSLMAYPSSSSGAVVGQQGRAVVTTIDSPPAPSSASCDTTNVESPCATPPPGVHPQLVGGGGTGNNNNAFKSPALSAVERKRQELVARAEALRRRKMEVQLKWQEVDLSAKSVVS